MYSVKRYNILTPGNVILGVDIGCLARLIEVDDTKAQKQSCSTQRDCGGGRGVKLYRTKRRELIHTMLCRNFGGNVAAGDDGNSSTGRVSNDSTECHNVYILESAGGPVLISKKVNADRIHSHEQRLA